MCFSIGPGIGLRVRASVKLVHGQCDTVVKHYLHSFDCQFDSRIQIAQLYFVRLSEDISYLADLFVRPSDSYPEPRELSAA